MRAVEENSTATVLSDDEAEMVWAEVADFDGRAIRVRVSVPLSTVPTEFERALVANSECVATTDIGTGIIRMAFDADEASVFDRIRRLRAEAAAAGGTMVIEKASAELRRELDAWGDIGSTAELMRSIKARFDPQSILNPGKFISGI